MKKRIRISKKYQFVGEFIRLSYKKSYLSTICCDIA